MQIFKKNSLILLLAVAVLLLLATYFVTRTAPVKDLLSRSDISANKPVPPPIPQKRAWPEIQRILFAGDSMMQGVAPLVMRELKKTHPEWLLRNESQQSTGLTVKRQLDWVEKIKHEIVNHQLTTVVIFLGPNDPWDIYERRKAIRFPSPEWEAVYSGRVGEICEFAKDKNVHLIWIGLPVMKEKRVYRGATVQNPIFRDNMKRYDFDFVSTEELIGRLDQPYVRYATDLSGKIINLRANDGIHFSPQGLQRIAAAVLETIDAPNED